MTLRLDSNVSSDAEWDDFVKSAPHSTMSHLIGWSDVLTSTFGHRTMRLGVRQADGQLIDVLPITFVKSRLFGKFAVSVPYLNAGGPIGDGPSQELLVKSAVSLALQEGIDSVLLRASRPLSLATEPTFDKVAVGLSLPADSEMLMKSFSSQLRSQIRRSAKEGAHFCSGHQELEAFYYVYSRHMRDLGTPALSQDFFSAVVRKFPENVRIGAVYHEGQPIAVGMGFRWRECFELNWAASLLSYKRLAPNMFLYWSLFDMCIAEGAVEFDFGRTTVGSGAHKFKLQWGGIERPLPWYYFGRRPPKKEMPRFQIASRVWQRLPLSLANSLSPHLIRGLP